MPTTCTTPVVINLHHATAAHQAEAASAAGRRIVYVSAVHPRQLLGPLWMEEEYEGGWMENFRTIVQLQRQTHVFESPGFVADDPARLVAWVLQNLLRGASAASIQDALDRSTANTWAPVI